MIQAVVRGILKFLRSPVVASVLLAFISVWSIAATLIPQGEPSVQTIRTWAGAHPVVAPFVAGIGLHDAFGSAVFLVPVFVLGLSMLVCSWERTRATIARTRLLRQAASADRMSVSQGKNMEIPCAPGMGPSEALSAASDALHRLGIKTVRRDDVVSAVSSPVSTWGSPLFHWALLALMVVILVGNLGRSDGMMALVVGQTLPDAVASYGVVHAGPLHDWSRVRRSFRLDSFDPDYRTGGIDRGAVPTVSVLDSKGRVVRTQRVYPNMMLHSGSVSISAAAHGLTLTAALLDANGGEVDRSNELIDFSQTATDGTVPVQPLAISDDAGEARFLVEMTVPMDGTPGHFGESIPASPTARVVVKAPDGSELVNRIIRPGVDVPLPDGSSLRIVDLGWYSRLSIVDDWTTPFLYSAMALAGVGLSITLLFRQQIVLVTALESPEGTTLVATVRLWRNVFTTRDEIETALRQSVAGPEKEGRS